MKQPPHLLVPCLLLMAISAPATLIAGAEVYQRKWPQWRGPAGNGLVLHGNPPLEWSEEQNVKWKVSIPGRGHATPIIWEDKIVVLTAVPMSAEPGATAEESPVPAAPASPGPRGGPGQRRGGGDGMVPTTDYDQAMRGLSYSCGLRRAELFRLELTDLSPERRTLTIARESQLGRQRLSAD